ncbi:hypothetical protein [Lysobacter capsici]|uniref:hypothetical protein n=1 Tax=Lysobacter capsici TaxID=435897 RepID=UPI001C0027C7|nr:hypothetical protein [Lysobacter capsici]QWF18100.1 hypothetical protein KME82_04845 [Lysobacter capsici]
MSANGSNGYSVDLSRTAVWKLIAVILVATAAVVALALWLPTTAGEQDAAPQPSLLWRAGSFALIGLACWLGYRLTAGPRARAWRIAVAVLAVALVLVVWRTLGLGVAQYNAHWGQAYSVVGETSKLQQRQRRGRSGAVTTTLSFAFIPDTDGLVPPLRIETHQALGPVLYEHPRLRVDVRRSWAGISFSALRPCASTGSDCGTPPPER